MAARQRSARVLWPVLLLALGCEKEKPAPAGQPQPAPSDPVPVSFSGAPELPTLQITAPRFLEPLQITDPPVVYMLNGVDVDIGFSAHIGIQPAGDRRSPPRCSPKLAPTDEAIERPREGLTIERCSNDEGELEVVIDIAFRDAWPGSPFYCVSKWRWASKAEMAEPWRAISAGVERACDTVAVK